MRAILLAEVVIFVSCLIWWPPPTGDARTVLAVFGAIAAMLTLAAAERGARR